MLGKSSFIYILSNKPNGVLYVGVTSSLIRRIGQHKSKEIVGFASKYNLTKLVYYEVYDDIVSAITREKQLKNWRRQWKLELIEKHNPNWDDLYDEVLKS